MSANVRVVINPQIFIITQLPELMNTIRSRVCMGGCSGVITVISTLEEQRRNELGPLSRLVIIDMPTIELLELREAAVKNGTEVHEFNGDPEILANSLTLLEFYVSNLHQQLLYEVEQLRSFTP